VAAILYLLPTPIAEAELGLSVQAQALACRLDYFLAENAKSARAFLRRAGHPRPMRELAIVEIGHQPDSALIPSWLDPIEAGREGAIVSEAGCPAVADPGAALVAAAHARGIQVRPLVGPSAILLALMASGLNGQQFRFHGYLPIAAAERTASIAAIERTSLRGETQVFIETPYRGAAMFDAVLATCAAATQLAVAIDLTGAHEFTATRSVERWRTGPRPPFDKRPAVFCLLA
jgi:16S rRNA (cytidine1402-2'-O)-methyltransferase